MTSRNILALVFLASVIPAQGKAEPAGAGGWTAKPGTGLQRALTYRLPVDAVDLVAVQLLF